MSVSLINGHIDPDKNRMTTKQAYKILTNTPIRAKDNHAEYSKALHIAMAALQKQVPMKPQGRFDSVPHYRCPSCYGAVVVYENSPKFDFCVWCG